MWINRRVVDRLPLQKLLLFLLSTYGTVNSQLVITTEDGDVFTNKTYFALEEPVQFTCSGGINLRWYYMDLLTQREVPTDVGGVVYQVGTSTEQVLHVDRRSSTVATTFICRSSSDSNARATIYVKEDKLQSVVAVNSSSVRVTLKADVDTGVVYTLRYCKVKHLPCASTSARLNNDRQTYLNGLEPYTFYDVSVSGYSMKRRVQTLSASPSGPPQDVTYSIKELDVMALSWQIPSSDSRNGVITYYSIWCYDVIPGQTKNFSLAVSNFTHPESLTTTVPVQENVTYTCRIAAGNVAGLGPYSDPQQVSIRRIVLLIESDDRGTVHITWTTPQIVPGVNQIGNIKFQYGLYRGMSSNVMYIDVPGVTQPSVLLDELEDGKPYKVLATIDISYVRITASKILFSKEIAPAVTVDDLSAIALNGTAVLLSWKPLTLEQAGGFPTYRVSLLSGGGAPVVLETNESLVIINDLTPGLKYEVQVNAVTKGGEGPLLKQSLTTPTDTPPVDSLSNSTVIIISVCVTVVLLLVVAIVAVLTVVLFVLVKKSRQGYNYYTVRPRTRKESTVIYEGLDENDAVKIPESGTNTSESSGTPV